LPKGKPAHDEVEESVNRSCKFLFTIFFVILTATLSLASDIYIAQNLVGGNTGADCADAHAATWFNSSSNWGGGATQISPGTTVHVCGTITGSAGGVVLSFQGSGSNSNPITLYFENGAGLSAPYCGMQGNDQACLVLSTPNSPHSNVVVDGGSPCGWTVASGSEGTCNGTIVNTANGTSLSNQQDSQAIEAENCNNCEIRNLGIYNIYVQSGGATNADPQNQNCITYSGSNNLIHDNQMHDVGWCLFYKMVPGDTNNKVYQNDVYNTPHPMFFANAGGANGTATNSFVYANHFHDYVNWNTTNCVYHVEGIHSSGPSSPPFPVFNGLEIYNNYFGPNEGSCLFSQVYLSPNTTSPGSAALVNQATVFNNVFNLTQAGEIAITIGGGNGNAVYNNTLLDVGYSGSIGLNWSNISQNSSYTLSIKNNATQGFYTMVNDDMQGSEGDGIVADYNAYSNCVAPYGQCLNAFVNGGTSTWPTYQGNSFQQEKSSITSGLGNQNKCCTGTLGLNTTTYVPQSGSVVIAAATNLTSLCTGNLAALCYDAGGNPRPSSGNWDAGAYQTNSSAPPQAPTGLTATVQ
jgi:hypothetical protein